MRKESRAAKMRSRLLWPEDLDEESGWLLFIGDDWAEGHHDVVVHEDSGETLARRRLPEGGDGIARFHALVKSVPVASIWMLETTLIWVAPVLAATKAAPS